MSSLNDNITGLHQNVGIVVIFLFLAILVLLHPLQIFFLHFLSPHSPHSPSPKEKSPKALLSPQSGERQDNYKGRLPSGSGIVVNLPGSPVQTSARRLLALQLATAEVVVEFTAASGNKKKSPQF